MPDERAAAIAPLPASRSRLLTTGLQEIGGLVAVLVAAMLLLAFTALAGEVLDGDTHALDTAIVMAMRTPGDPADPLGPPWFEEMMRDVTALGSNAVLVVLLLSVLGYLLLLHKRASALLVAAAVLGGTLLNHLLKIGIARPRPELEQTARVFTASFPSGHATLSAVTFLTLGALLARAHPDRRVKLYCIATAIVLTILVGVSRIYLGVHYPTDVLAGWSLGSAWAILCWATALWLQRRAARRDGAVREPRNGARDAQAHDPDQAN